MIWAAAIEDDLAGTGPMQTRQTRLREGRYLLRTNLVEEDPAKLWGHYLLLMAVEEAFKNLKGDLAIRPVFHQLEVRHVAIGHQEAAHVSLAPGPFPSPKRVSSAPRSRGDGDAARAGYPIYLLNTLAAITCKEAGFRSRCDAWADTTTAPGRTVCYQAALYPRWRAARL